MADYSALKVVELKDLLKERGIPSTGLGRKQQIVEALEAYDAEHAGEESQEGDAIATPGSDADDALAEDSTQAAEAGGENDEAKEDVPMIFDPQQPESDDKPEEEPEVKPSEHVSLPQNERLRLESPSAESISSEAKKRKRRSPTPSLSDTSVAKKLKVADASSVTLPEDESREEQVNEKENSEDKTADEPSQIEPTAHKTDIIEKSRRRSDDTPPSKSRVDSRRLADMSQIPDRPVEPALHQATEALYVCNLIRPVQRQDLRDYIATLATPRGAGVDDSVIEAFHLDSFRSHALVVLRSISAATRVRSLLHDRVWPDEPGRKALWVDYIPSAKVRGWIDMELNSGSNRHEAKRWEVVYTQSEQGMTADLQEVSSTPIQAQRSTDRAPQIPPSNQTTGPVMPNAPTGPRGSHRQQPQSRDHHWEKAPPPAPSPPPSGNSGSFDVLDERFKFTITKPKLYYLPHSIEVVNKRLDELDALTSRDWDPKRDGSFSFQDSTLRRYTFEDGYRLVDGGADIGNFGKPTTGMRRGGGGKGRGRL